MEERGREERASGSFPRSRDRLRWWSKSMTRCSVASQASRTAEKIGRHPRPKRMQPFSAMAACSPPAKASRYRPGEGFSRPASLLCLWDAQMKALRGFPSLTVCRKIGQQPRPKRMQAFLATAASTLPARALRDWPGAVFALTTELCKPVRVTSHPGFGCRRPSCW